jgi:hypothetical protein
VVIPGVSLDELVARFENNPMGTATSGYGSIFEGLGEGGISPRHDDAGFNLYPSRYDRDFFVSASIIYINVA